MEADRLDVDLDLLDEEVTAEEEMEMPDVHGSPEKIGKASTGKNKGAAAKSKINKKGTHQPAAKKGKRKSRDTVGSVVSDGKGRRKTRDTVSSEVTTSGQRKTRDTIGQLDGSKGGRPTGGARRTNGTTNTLLPPAGEKRGTIGSNACGAAEKRGTIGSNACGAGGKSKKGKSAADIIRHDLKNQLALLAGQGLA